MNVGSYSYIDTAALMEERHDTLHLIVFFPLSSRG